MLIIFSVFAFSFILSFFFSFLGKKIAGEKWINKFFILEIISGCLSIAIYSKYGLTFLSLKYLLMIEFLLVLSTIDLKTHFLPDKLMLPFIITGITFSVLFTPGISSSIKGAAMFNLPFLLMYSFGEDILKKDILGFGDVKLALGIGAFIGYTSFIHLYLFFTISFALGAFIGVSLILLKIKKKSDLIPFGPYISLAGIIMLFII